MLLACGFVAPLEAQAPRAATAIVVSAGLLPTLRAEEYASGATFRIGLEHNIGRQSDLRLFVARSHWGRSHQVILLDRLVPDRANRVALRTVQEPYLERPPTIWEIGAGVRYGEFSRRVHLYGLTEAAAAHLTAKAFYDSAPIDQWRLSVATGLGIRFRGTRVRPLVEARLVWYGSGDAEPRFAFPVTGGVAIAL